MYKSIERILKQFVDENVLKMNIKYEFYGKITTKMQEEIEKGLLKVKKDIEKALSIPVDISWDFIDLEMSLKLYKNYRQICR